MRIPSCRRHFTLLACIGIGLAFYTSDCWGQAEFNVPGDTPPDTIADGQTLNFYAPGVEDDSQFYTIQSGGSFNLHSGTYTTRVLAEAGSTATVYGGTLYGGVFYGSLTVFDGVYLDIGAANTDQIVVEGGKVSTDLESVYMRMNGGEAQLIAHGGSKIDIYGGMVTGGTLLDDSEINLYGGEFKSMSVSSDSSINFFGGEFADEPFFSGGGTATLYGSDFAVDGTPVPTLSPGQTYTVPNVDSLVSGVFEDGSPFAVPYFSGSVTLRLARSVPEPASLSLLLTLLTAIPRRPRIH